MTCCLCKKPIDKQANGWDKGHNAMPIKEGQCCTYCNDTLVVPTRLREAGVLK